MALVNPPWTFAGSVYFGCREPHLPLEFGYSRGLLEAHGHEVALVDGHLRGLSVAEVAARVEAFRPDLTVVTTAPSYLFWRCPPPELTVPRRMVQALRGAAGTLAAVGPHPSITPAAALGKLGVDLVLRGEFEQTLARLAGMPSTQWAGCPGVVTGGGRSTVAGQPSVVEVATLPPIRWEDSEIAAHQHHHHRFDAPPMGPGAEVEASRGCPYRCSFCAREAFRDAYRRRPLQVVLSELDALLAQGVEYVYFVDEIFMPDLDLLEALAERALRFGVQTRIDLWEEDELDRLGRAGCVSIEAGVESISEEGRQRLSKRSRLSTERMTTLLAHAKQTVPFVQASLVATEADSPAEVAAWREQVLGLGIWANEPVPVFPYPGSREYRRRWGEPDGLAWERAHEYYLAAFRHYSDIQEESPLSLAELEGGDGE